MANLFKLIFGNQAEPIRRDLNLRITEDSKGKRIIEAVEGESITISKEGSIDRIHVKPDRFYHCGCSAQEPMGGQCGEPGCNKVSCQRCFSRCYGCHKPLCLVHARVLEASHTQHLVFCLECLRVTRRNKIIKAAARSLLSPIIDFKNK